MYNNELLSKCQIEVNEDFKPRKQKSLTLSSCYDFLGLPRKAERVERCGNFLEFHITEGEAKLHQANFCKDRLCPMCNWRRSKKIFAQVSSVMDELEKNGFRFLFLTLTIKNCEFHDLSEAVNVLLSGWTSLTHKAAYKKAVHGAFRTLEITVNRKTCTFHPHLHVILAVNSEYFHKAYIKTSKWSELWEKSCALDYSPIVHVQAVKSGKLDATEAISEELSKRSFRSAAKEVSKYVAKGSDYLDGETEEILLRVQYLAEALEARRLASFSGVFKEAAAVLRLDDVEDGDLVHVETKLRQDISCVIVRYLWRAGLYEREVIE